MSPVDKFVNGLDEFFVQLLHLQFLLLPVIRVGSDVDTIYILVVAD